MEDLDKKIIKKGKEKLRDDTIHSWQFLLAVVPEKALPVDSIGPRFILYRGCQSRFRLKMSTFFEKKSFFCSADGLTLGRSPTF